MFIRRIDGDLSLALVQPSFAKAYLGIVTEERDDLARYLPWAAHAHDEDFFLTYIKTALHGYADGVSMSCAIIYNGQLVGNISFNKIDYNSAMTQIGYWLSKPYRRRGIVTKSVAKLIDIAFYELYLTKVEIRCATRNRASRRVAERLGFILKGAVIRAENINGRVVDHAVYVLDKNDWDDSLMFNKGRDFR